MRYFYICMVVILTAFSKSVWAQPANDNCNNASDIPISGNGFGLGTFVSSSSDLTSATIQAGEEFAPSIFVAAQNQKSVWYKFTIASNRKVTIRLRQAGNTIVAGDVGFAVYYTTACLPGASQLSSKLIPLETFGNTFHPCVDSGTYLVQVSSKNRANGLIYLEVVTEATTALYDNMAAAYDFGVMNTHRKAVSYVVGCHSLEGDETVCNNLMGNTGRPKTSWHVFTTAAYNDYIDLAFSGGAGYFTGPNINEVVGYRVFRGDARTSSFNALIPVAACDTFRSDGATVSLRRFSCGILLPNTTYSVQLIFSNAFNHNIKLGIFAGGTQASGGPQPATTSLTANNTLGVLANGTVTRTDYFACNALHQNNACGPTKPAGGVVYGGVNYNVSSYFTFSTTTEGTVTIQTALLPAAPACGGRLIRVFNTGLTSNCNNLTLANLYDEFTDGKVLNCLPPGNYTIQVLSSVAQNTVTNAEIQTSTALTCIRGNLGRGFTLTVTKANSAGSLFRLHQAGAFNNINNGLPLANNTTLTSIRDTFGCTRTVLPNNTACNTTTQYNKAKYRQLVLNDSGTLTVSDLPVSVNVNGQQRFFSYELFQGNANSLATAQNVWNYPQRINGLTSVASCITQTNTFSGCLLPGQYTFVEYGNDTLTGTSSQPRFSFKKPVSAFGNWNAPNNMGDVVSLVGPSGGNVTATPDTFTCSNNAITIGGIAPCGGYAKAIYREFYVSDSIFLRIQSSNSAHQLSFFKGRISTQGPAAMQSVWTCFTNRQTLPCEFIAPGWYTVVSYGMGASYGINNITPNHVNTQNNITLTISFDCKGPRFNRPHKAAVDSLTGNPFLITWNQAADTGAYPNTAAEYTLPTEYFNCTADTPFVYTGNCGGQSYSKVAYYVFRITQESYVNVLVNEPYYTKVYAGNIRQDSIAFINATPVSACVRTNQRLEICRMQPGTYTLVIYANNGCLELTPKISIDKVGISRFDFARNAYDFDVIQPNNTYQSGRTGDINPQHPGRAASSDFFFCTTGAYTSDPADAACLTNVNNAVYTLPNTNKVLYATSSGSYTVRRNLWYTFVVDRPGKYTVKIDSKTPNKTQQVPFAIYKSDVDGNLTFQQVVAGGLVDSSFAQGLTLRGTNLNTACGSFVNEYTFTVTDCELNGRERYYILANNRNDNSLQFTPNLNYQIDVAVKLDTANASFGNANDFYITAGNIGTLNIGSNNGNTASYQCATRNASYPVPLAACAQKTLWYRFAVPANTSGDVKIRLNINGTSYAYNASDFLLFREMVPNDSTATGLSEVPLQDIANYRRTCIQGGTYYLLLTGCNRTGEFVTPEIVFDTLTGDFCYNAVPVNVLGAGNASATVSVDCHTIGTDYGEFASTLTCPPNGITSDYKTSWYKINIQSLDTFDIRVSLTENLNANANQIFYRMMTGGCNAMIEQSCVQDIQTQNTYFCVMPNTDYYIQVFTPVYAYGNTLTTGTVTLNLNASNHVDTCAPVSPCLLNANFTVSQDCDSVFITNYSTYGSSIRYFWDFGDGSGTSTAINPAYRYPALPVDSTYTITLRLINTDCNDTAFAFRNITIPARPDVNLGPDTMICNTQDSITLNVFFPGATYLWSTSATGQSIRVGTPGLQTYFVAVTYNGCTYTDTVRIFKTVLVPDPPETYNICGAQDTVTLDATRLGGTYTYLWNTTDTTAAIRTSQAGWYTADISDGYCSVTDSFRVLDRRDSVFVSDSACANALPFSWNNISVNSFGVNVASFTALNRFGCDSVVVLSLYAKQVDTTPVFDTTCASTLPYVFYGNNINSAGIYSHTLTNRLGCDSIIRLTLTVHPSYNDTLPVSICNGDSFLFNGVSHTAAGFYNHSFSSSLGCDSLVTLRLTISPYLTRTQYDTICYGATYTLPSSRVVSNPGIYYDTLSGFSSCDSVITTHLFVRPQNTAVAAITICAGQLPYSWNGIPVTSGGNGVATYTTADRYGCDSTTTLNLTVNPADTTRLTESVCSDLLPYNFFGTNLTAGGIYNHMLTNRFNCDSLIILDLTVLPAYRDTTFTAICSGDSFSFQGRWYLNNGIYTVPYITAGGCDSVKVLSLTVNPRSPRPVVTSPVRYCVGATPVPVSATGTNILWYTSLGGTGVAAAPVPNTGVPGRTVFYVTQNSNGCESYKDSVVVFVSEKLAPDFMVLPDSVICTSDTLLVIYTGQTANGAVYRWSWNGASSVSDRHPDYRVSWSFDGMKRISVYVDNNGCIGDTVHKDIRVNKAWEKPAVSHKEYYCAGDEINLKVTSVYTNDAVYHWTYNGDNMTAAEQLTLQVFDPGWHYFTLYVDGGSGCLSEMLRDSFYVSGFPEFTLKSSTVAICENDTVFLSVPWSDDVKYTFGPSIYFPADLRDEMPGYKSAFIHKSGYVYAIAANSFGCEWQDSLFIDTEVCCDLFVPNAFSPNGDGLNDELQLLASNLQTVQKFAIYNRYGEMVFSAASQHDKWDGTFRSKAADMGVYHYYLVYICSDGTEHIKRGQIHLIR